jgi:hypothetical protein
MTGNAGALPNELPRRSVTAKLRKKPPLLLERVGVRRIKNKAKALLIPSS